ncbi:MAG: insulinase family protein [Gammaproteobacteria bacterium]|nr:insulinase family protein [Gammaproteobacteria bacterium]MBU1439690.1 insulinase family protein [Gammaproteobacteria bacterium]MBU2287892.1 insulinase family protein [Gammaproteobacteria bacterium]MBU2410076.1 insulinase family protein [Gammaproteobacteria bacterium]
MVRPLAAPGATILQTLPNGVRLLVVPMPHVQSASVGVFLRVGSRDETPSSNGISHVLEHMAFKGTNARSVQAINLDAERLGAEVNAFTGKDTTGYFMTGLGRHAEQLLRMTADIVLHSTFPETELQRELDVIRQEAIEYEEDPEDSGSDLLDRAIWGDDPMGMPVIGTVGNIEGFTRQDLVRHVQSHYVAENTVVAAAGNFDVDAWLALATELFEPMRPSEAPSVSRLPAPAAYVGQPLARRFTQVSQVYLNIAFPVAPARLDQMSQQRWRLAASLATNLFGGGMSAPLVDTVREQLGLAYTAHSTLDSGDVWANFVVHAVTTPDKLEALVTSTGSLLHAQSGAIDPVHLERAKNQLTVSRVRAGERTYAAMEQAVDEVFASASVTPMAQALAMIEDISAQEVQDVFGRMLANAPALAIAGKGVSARMARQLAARLQHAYA